MFFCDSCEHEADATYKRDRDGVLRWQVGNTFTPRCPKGGDCLDRLAEWLGTQPSDLLQDPRPHLPAGARRDRPAWLEPLLSDSAWGWGRRLLLGSASCSAAREYLREHLIDFRLHDLAHAERWGYPAIVARCYAAGRVATETYRFYGRAPLDRKGRPMKDSMLRRGESSSGWIARMPPGQSSTLLTAGFRDGLIAVQNGLPGISASCGCRLPDHLVPDLAGRKVAVAYDVGEEAEAELSVDKLRGAGCGAWVVHLEKLGLPDKGDLADYFRQGGTRADLLDQIKRDRRAS